MDIPGLSMELAGISAMSKITTSMLDKTMDTNEVLGEGLIKMMDSVAMEHSVNPLVGTNFDLRI